MAAASGDGGKRQPFGNRFLTDPARVFQHNAWDNVEWSEEQEAAAQAKVQENSTEFVSKDQQDAYEMDAHTYWNDFYKTHENGFFKDRHWLFTEFPELAPNHRHSQAGTGASEDAVENAKNSGCGCCSDSGISSVEPEISKQLDCEKNSSSSFYHSHTEDEMETQKLEEEELRDTDFPGSSATYRILEVGCGAGNTVFPILQTNNSTACDLVGLSQLGVLQWFWVLGQSFLEEGWISDPGLFVYCCDFSTTAVDLVKAHPEYDASRCFAFVHDLSKNGAPFPMPDECLDVVVLIFVLSAILPEKMQCVITRLSHLLKPGGIILLRDYGRYDLAQLRFKKGQCLADNFYVRGDGTRVYFFTQAELDLLFSTAGLEKVQNMVDRRLQVNRGKQVTMYRVWVQCKYCKPQKPRTEESLAQRTTSHHCG